MNRYNPKDIEPKWQKFWEETSVYTADLESDRPKYIAMSMFNYPSGAGIHIGHALNYTISDVKARFKRQQGYESYHPVGWDAFGLPAENYAIKSGVSPQESMANIIPGYHKQYKAMGWSNDWEKEIATHLPEYYKWTQWIFAQMFKHGLAYQDSRLQWWCEKDNTVLANEQIVDGKCWRHDGPDDPLVQKKEIKQWFFKITEYADELLEATDGLDWTETVKIAQKNWIGRSEGAEIDFKIEGSEQAITVFTTRPDTLFGVTFMVVAPEHDIVAGITNVEQKKDVDEYVQLTQKKSELERQTQKDKTGVFTGSYAVNPINGEKIPVWIADYVLAGYGTGAIMAVPAHDERDEEFAKRFELPIRDVIEPTLIQFKTATQEQYEQVEKMLGERKWDSRDPSKMWATFTHDLLVSEIRPELDRLGISYNYPPQVKEGRLINSGEFDGQSSASARENIVKKLADQGKAAKKLNYKMRDWSVSRQRYWGAPIPIVECPKCGPVLVADDQLPVILPELDDFAPNGDGRSSLARATDWLNVDCPKCGGPAERETDTLDTYICSSWYMFRYLDPRNQQKIFDSEVVNRWAPIDFYNGGDHATAHLLYARFVTRFFTKIGLMENPEPFKQMLFNGKVTAQDGSPFSKSKGNGIDPLQIIDSGYGADALRMYLMFASPLELTARWDPQGVPGTHRFLTRVWNLVQSYNESKEVQLSDDQQFSIHRATHAMIRKMTEDIEHNRYNTAIAAAMACINDLYKLKNEAFGKHKVWQEALESLVACIGPFAPHITEELWHQLGHSTTAQRDSWPTYDERYLVSETMKIVVQVNGRVRAQLEVASDAQEPDIIAFAKADDKVAAYIAGKELKKTIYVPGKLVSFVV
jgi:leucyl-tRNA synthetase